MDSASASSPFLTDTSCHHYSCDPACLEVETYDQLSTRDAFKELTIHTDELFEVLSHLVSGSLTIVIVRHSNLLLSQE